jgi:YD repeat-containing protein
MLPTAVYSRSVMLGPVFQTVPHLLASHKLGFRPLPRHFSRGLASYSCATGTGVSHFSYDATNMINRIESTVTYDPQEFDAQNRLISVNRVGAGTTTFAYDAAGIRVKTVHPGGKTSYFPFPGYEEEVNGSTTTRRITYAIAGQTVALRVQVVEKMGERVRYHLLPRELKRKPIPCLVSLSDYQWFLLKISCHKKDRFC